jgi:hypothetical protein
MEAARALALKTLSEADRNDGARIVYAFRRCVARKPSEQEISDLTGLLEKEKRRYDNGKRNPWELLSDDPARRPSLPKDVGPADAAAWTLLSRVILNLDETITKE